VRKIEVPVLIVGGGGAGLSASNILADLGVESLMIERHASTSHLPKAHYLNPRTMEIYRQHGLADAVYEASAPRDMMAKVHWYTSLGGDGPVDRVRLLTADALGGGAYKAAYDEKSAAPPANVPQIRLEPVLSEHAARRNPGRVLYRHELISFTQDAQSVSALVRDLEAGEDITVEARYMIAADAGKTVGPALGVAIGGTTNLAEVASVHFSGDLSSYVLEDDCVLRVFVRPDRPIGRGGFSGAMLTLGPKHWDGRSEEWLIAWAHMDGEERVDAQNAVAKVQEYLKIDQPLTIHQVSYWTVEGVLADSFQKGRILIIGDAAHKHAPFAGLGLNSAIQDAHNVCWKLALVLKGLAPPELLTSYERERRPVVADNAAWSLFAFENKPIMMATLGIMASAPVEANIARVQKLIADNAGGASRRQRLADVSTILRTEFSVHDLEMGYTYANGAIVDDGQAFPPRDPMGHHYTPSSRPGCRLPHAWLDYEGDRVSTHDLVPKGGFLLLTGSKGEAWSVAASRLATETGLPIRAVRVGPGGDAADPSGKWRELSGVEEDGAVLVRPDGFVAYRGARQADAHLALKSAMATILAGGVTATSRAAEPVA
jgi:2,4-dichlorophenol 6-monooxygenase